MNDKHLPKLPESFEFISKARLQAQEIIHLRLSVGWSADTEERWSQCLDQSLAVIGVIDDHQKLVGMGCLAGNVRHAVLCDLVVRPDQQGKGIGKALLLERLRIAHELNVSYVYTEIAKTNALRELYVEMGFKKTGNGLFLANV